MSEKLPDPKGLEKVAKRILGSIRGLKFNVTVDQENKIVKIDVTQGNEKLGTKSAWYKIINLEAVIKPYRLRL